MLWNFFERGVSVVVCYERRGFMMFITSLAVVNGSWEKV